MNEGIGAINHETGPAPLRREAPEALDGLLVHGKGVLCLSTVCSKKNVVGLLVKYARELELELIETQMAQKPMLRQ